MTDYKKLYFECFNRISDIIDYALKMQQECEELYLQEADYPLIDSSAFDDIAFG